MIKQECIGIPDMILLLMIFCFKKIKIKAEIVLSPRGAYFSNTVFKLALSQILERDCKTAFIVRLVYFDNEMKLLYQMSIH